MIMNDNFLEELQKQAKIQKTINEGRIFPEFFDEITSFMGTYSWQTLFILALLSSILIEII